MNRRIWIVVGALAALLVVATLVWDGLAGRTPGGPADSASSAPTDLATAPEAPDPTESQDPTEGTTEPVESPSPTPSETTPPEPPAQDPTAPPVDLEDPAEIGTVTARLSTIQAIEGEADGPGEIAGPALRVTVALTNGGSDAVDLTGVVVNLYSGPDAVPAELLAGNGSAWFEGSLAPGANASGTYVFTVPLETRGLVQVTVFLTPEEPTVLFEGAV